MTPEISVIIPAHNPRADYLGRVLAALQGQTLPRERWEMVVVDNASDPGIAGRFPIGWHPRGRHLREEKLGLTPARLAGIAATTGPVVVFVDDDNELHPDFLETALRLSGGFPYVGAWGGQVFPEFEDPGNHFARNYPSHFTARSFSRDQWTNRKRDYDIMPIGAGLCVRRAVLEKYAAVCRDDPRRLLLDRTGTRLLTCGDLDIVFTACDAGFGKALFHQLKLVHLIPRKRLSESFLIGNQEGNHYSSVIQNYLVDHELPATRLTLLQQLGRLYRLARLDGLSRRMALAGEKGRRDALRDIAKWGWLKDAGRR